MQRGEPVEIDLHAVGQGVVSRTGTGEAGIPATVGRHRMQVQYARHGRDFRAGLVRMPDIARDPRRLAVGMKLATLIRTEANPKDYLSRLGLSNLLSTVFSPARATTDEVESYLHAPSERI